MHTHKRIRRFARCRCGTFLIELNPFYCPRLIYLTVKKFRKKVRNNRNNKIHNIHNLVGTEHRHHHSIFVCEYKSTCVHRELVFNMHIWYLYTFPISCKLQHINAVSYIFLSAFSLFFFSAVKLHALCCLALTRYIHVTLIWEQAILAFIQAHRTCIHIFLFHSFVSYSFLRCGWTTVVVVVVFVLTFIRTATYFVYIKHCI